MQCEEVREQFADYVIDRIPEPVRSVVEAHLESCAECRSDLGEIGALWKALKHVPVAEPPAELESRFGLMLEAYKQGLQRPAFHWWHPALQIGLAAAALIIGVAVGYRMHTTSVPTGDIAELRNELSQTRQMVALSLMQEQSATDRLRGVNWSYRLQEPGAEVLKALLDTLMHDSNVNVRLATVDALRQFGDRPAVRQGVVEAMTRQESPMVQIALIDLAVDLHEKESLGVLKQLTNDQNLDQAVRERAQRGLQELE